MNEWSIYLGSLAPFRDLSLLESGLIGFSVSLFFGAVSFAYRLLRRGSQRSLKATKSVLKTVADRQERRTEEQRKQEKDERRQADFLTARGLDGKRLMKRKARKDRWKRQ